MTSAHDMHGLTVTVSADDDAVGAAVRARLRRFPERSADGGGLRFSYRRVPADGPHAAERPAGEGLRVYEPPAGEVLHFPEPDTFLIDYDDRVRVVCEAMAGTVTVSVRPQEAGNLWLLSRPMFTLPLLELAKRRGLYGVHAAAAARDGRGILLPASSGSGKSTLTIALARGGFDVLGDDLVFLRDHGDDLRALAFPDDIDVTAATAALFPDLDGTLGAPPEAGWPKLAVAPGDLGASVAESCRPAALVFPHIGAGERSELQPLGRAEALLRLAPDVMMTDRAASQAHLDALGRLVRRCTCWQLAAGRDLDAIPALLARVLD